MSLKEFPIPMNPTTVNVSDDEDDMPEAVSLASGKANALGRVKDVHDFQATTLRKQKEMNKARDATQKALAAERKAKEDDVRKGKGKAKAATSGQDDEDSGIDSASDGGDDADALEKRMEKAMRQAAEEMSDDEDLEGQDDGILFMSDAEDDDEKDSDVPDSDSQAHSGDEGDEHAGDSEDNDLASLPPITKRSKRPNSADSEAPSKKSKTTHLPDSVFAAAAASLPTPSTSSSKPKRTTKIPRKQKRRKNTGDKGKDIVIGSRTLRVLQDLSRPKPETTPDRKRAFEARTARAKKGRFERRPVALTLAHGRIGAPRDGFVRR